MTENVPFDQQPTQAAWSAVPPPPVYDYPPTGEQPIVPRLAREHAAGLKLAGAAVAVMAGAVALAALIPAWREPPWQGQPPTPVTVTATATSMIPAPVTQTETTTATITATPQAGVLTSDDERYVNLLVSHANMRRDCLDSTPLGSGNCSPDPTLMIGVGHAQCGYLALAGVTVASVSADLHHEFPAWTLTQAREITDAAVSAYCPQIWGGHPFE